MSYFKITTIAVAVALFASVGANAQMYSDVSNSEFSYSNIFESSGGGLFGQPDASGNQLEFPVSTFSANGVDGGVDFLNGMLNLDVSSNSGEAFSTVSLDEFGVYFNTGDSFSSVDAFLTVVIDQSVYTDSFNFSFNEGSGLWSGSASVVFPETFEATIFVHNILLANSVADEVASISKRNVTLTIGEAIPEPTACGILAIGLIGLVGRRKR